MSAAASMVSPAELRDVQEMLDRKIPGMDAFVTGGEARFGHSVILVGNRSLGWKRAMTVYGGDHVERAKRYCQMFRGI
jgi:hypothetical protein